jgi:uncharacterized integral membrane protein
MEQKNRKRNNKKTAGIVLMIIGVVGFILFLAILIIAGVSDSYDFGYYFALFYITPLAVLFLLIAIAGEFTFLSGVKEEKRNHEYTAIGGIRCPECGAPTELRTVKKVKNIRNRFWVCIKYPECKGRIQLHEKAL